MGIRDELMYTKARNTSADASLKKQFNIDAFAKLDRAGLEFGVVERRLLIFETGSNEKIYIQYPGKETKNSKEERIRPWDFRPKLFKDSTQMPDLSFGNIWDDLYQMSSINEQAVSYLASIFYRMAYMIGYEKVKKQCVFEDFEVGTGKIVNQGLIDIEIYAPVFSRNLIEYFDSAIGNVRGFSLEAYLYYNELLVQNEDCKYYYRDTIANGGVWSGKAGRLNTFLSHMSVIQFIKGDATFSEIMMRFQRGMGVAPIPTRAIPSITDNIIAI